MACPHCNQEHPAGTLYCTLTGKKIAYQGKGSTQKQARPAVHFAKIVFLLLAAGLAVLLLAAEVVLIAFWNGKRPAVAAPRLQATSTTKMDWISHGPEGGIISALLIDPLTPTTLFAGGEGGLFESTDRGGHWNRAKSRIAYENVYCLVFDPATPTTLYAESMAGCIKALTTAQIGSRSAPV